ncbi:MAG: VOC family protein [Chloroflexota bacterium]|nr:VOC family protein [Chloroflexota bacterium]
MIANRSVPTATVIPELPYDDVARASEWLCRAFGFKERLRIGDHRAQLVLGDGAVIVTARGATSRAAVLVRVADVDRHHEQAKKNGARILQPPADHPYGERQYSAEDLGGHVWTFSQSIADVDPVSWGGILIIR